MSKANGRPVRITGKKVCGQIFRFGLNVGVTILFILGYVTLSSDLRDKTISKWFLSHIVFACIVTLVSACYTLFVVYYYDRVMRDDE